MKRTRSIFLVALMTMITLGFLGTMGIGTVSASDTAKVYVYPATRTGPYTAPKELTYQVRLSTVSGEGAPHVTTEPTAASTDKTWAWEVVIKFNASVVHVTTAPYRHASSDWFNFFHKWSWDEDMMEWEDLGAYLNFFGTSYDNVEGEVAAVCTLQEDVTTETLPTGDEPLPQAAFHSGSKYDLPWSDGLQGLAGYTYNYFILYLFKVTTQVAIPPGGTLFEITEASFVQYDQVTKYTVTTEDATLGAVVPEFPLGIEILMILAPIIPIIYLWRRKGWKK